MSDAKMAKIQKLLDVAEHPETNPEMAKNYREQAERLMVQYAIDEARLAARRMAEGVEDKPEVRRNVRFGLYGSPVLTQYYNLMIQIAKHNRCRFNGTDLGTGILVGFPKDMDFTEMMFASIRLQMISKVEPEPSLDKSFDENVWYLHECGVKWENIAFKMNHKLGELLGGPEASAADLPWDVVPWDEKKKDGGRLIRACKRWCKANDLPYRAISQPDVHLRSYAQGFLDMVSHRLREMRAHQQDEIKSTSGAELVLVSRADKVDSLYDEMFGHLKTRSANQKISSEARYRGMADGRNADLSGGRNHVGRTSKELS